MDRLLATRGILYLLTRFGGSVLRRSSFDQYYKSGKWDYFEKEHSPDMVAVVERCARGGAVLDMGCGPGALPALLNPESFESYVGIDASAEAIGRASKRQGDGIEFAVSDIQSYQCQGRFDVIVFEESLYYVPYFRKRLLDRYRRHLSCDGVFVVTVADVRRYRRMIGMIRKNFEILEDRCFENSERLLLVFR